MSQKKKPAAPIAAEAKEEVPCCGEDTCLDCIVPEEAETPLEDAVSIASSDEETVNVLAAIPLDPIGVYTVTDGDTYPGIAKRHKPEGSTVNEYARHLMSVNKNRPLTPGAIIRL